MYNYHSNYNSQKSLTDDLPVCKNTGVGYSINQIYRNDKNPQEAHTYEDFSCHVKYKDNMCYYAVFDGNHGKRAANFFSQQISAELLFWSMKDETKSDDDDGIKELLKQLFLGAETSYAQSLGDLQAERASILCELPKGVSVYEGFKNSPRYIERFDQINYELSSSTSTAIVLIHNKKLFVANIGNCRVLLCQTDENSVLKVIQLSVDHDLTNEDELLRLAQIGIDVSKFRQNSPMKNKKLTRFLGNYLLKESYKEDDEFCTAKQIPFIAEPDVHGGIKLDDSYRFLLVMSAGLYKSIEEATGTDQVNKFIAECTVEQFRQQATLTGVAQAVVDKAVRLHHDWYMSNSNSTSRPLKREDITLILRNFNFPLPNAITSPTNPCVTFSSSVGVISNGSDQKTFTSTSTVRTDDTRTTSSSDERSETDASIEKRIDAYVDFTDFNRNLAKFKNC